MPGKVADASILAAIFFEEPNADDADALIGDDEFFEPGLVAYELTSVAQKKTQRRPERSDAIAKALEVGLQTPITWAAVDHGAVLKLALTTGLSSYDATYLHVAQTLQLPLVTFDRRLQVVADELGIASI